MEKVEGKGIEEGRDMQRERERERERDTQVHEQRAKEKQNKLKRERIVKLEIFLEPIRELRRNFY